MLSRGKNDGACWTLANGLIKLTRLVVDGSMRLRHENKHGFNIWENTGSVRRTIDAYWLGYKSGVGNSGDGKRKYR